MSNAASLRQQLENSLSSKAPGALSPRLRVEPVHVSCGVPEFDQLLQGGLAVGALTELVGTECSGRTTMALAYAAACTRAGSVCAWIDVADAMDPESVAANGVDLERLLWVRCGSNPQAALSPGKAQNTVANVLQPPSQPPRHTGGGSPHPRSEGKDMPQAISAMLQDHGGLYDKNIRREKKKAGTPGAPNRPLVKRSEHREEQVNSDRLPARRGDNLVLRPQQVIAQPRRTSDSLPQAPLAAERDAGKPWQALDQALRAADLLLQGGGFSLIVLDLGGTPPESAWRIPLATWFRFRAACERTRVSLLLLTQHPCARSSAELVVRMETGSFESDGNVMTGIQYQATTERTRSHQNSSRVVPFRKPPQSERPGLWKSDAAWALVR